MTDPANEFTEAAKEKRRSFLGEIARFILSTKKYWLIPLIFILLVLAVVIILGQTALGPFIYTIF